MDGEGEAEGATSLPETSYSEYYKGRHLEREPLLMPSNGTSPMQPSSAGAASSSGGGGAPVSDALKRAQQALDQVETSLDSIDKLPSARTPPSSQLAAALSLARGVVIVGVLSSVLLASHAFGLVVQWLSAAAGGSAIAAWGYRKESLSRSGAIAAAAVGLATLGCSLRFGATLLAFFFSSSKLTQYKEEFKQTLDDATKKGGQRNWIQVLCNAGVPAVLAVTYGVLAGCVDVPLGPLPNLEAWRAASATALMGGFLGYYACCCGDTWASELGPLSRDTPRLITSMRPVRRGTNGGVTLLGLCASVAGGAFMGLVFYVAGLLSPTLFIFEHQHMAAIEQWRLVPLGLMAGLVGSLTDSVLGATLQFSGYNTVTGRVTSMPGSAVQHIAGRPLLSNNMVNLVSATVTAVLTALAALHVFGF